MSFTGSTSDAEREKRKGRRILGCFFGVFFLFGLGMSVVFLWPIVEILQAKSWRETPCTILTSEVQSHRGSKGSTTYSVGVSYEYFVEDQRYVSARYKFMGGSSSGYDGKAEVVRGLPPGRKTVCYVNRRNPADAVLERGFTSDIFFGFIPLIFAAIGAGGIFGTLFYKGKPKEPKPHAGLPAAGPSKGGSAELKPSTSPGMRLGCALVFALFWNGILTFFVVDIFAGWSKGRGDGCATVFMIPFLLVGLGILGLSFYYFLALFNPRPTIRVSNSSVALGDAVEIEWVMSGSVDRIKSFTIALEGREEATYRRGTSTATDKSVFATIELVKLTRSKEMRRGKAKAAIPLDTMHTFRSSNNKFLWQLQVKGEIPKWPDVDESFELTVRPLALPEKTP